jgi:hypothetical protein
MLYKRFKILFQTKLRRKIVIPKKEYGYCGDCDNYLIDDKGRFSCVLVEIDVHRIDACCEGSRRWNANNRIGLKYLPDAPKEIEDLK